MKAKQMTLKVGDVAYATQKALTQGIHKVTVQRVDDSGYLTLKGVWWGGREGRDVFATIDEAQAKVRVMAARALKALDKKRAHLEALARDGAKVNQ
jgi:hypothetical protein